MMIIEIGEIRVSRFKLIEIEETNSGSFPNLYELDVNRKTIFKVSESSCDEYGNKYKRDLDCFHDKKKAVSFLRSCRLTEGIELEKSE